MTKILVDQFARRMREGVKFPLAAALLGVPLRTAYSWREKGRQLSASFHDDLDAVPAPDQIYLHFLHEIEHSRAQCISEIVAIGHREIRSTSDALKFLEYLCPEEFGSRARRRLGEGQLQEQDLNQILCSIISESRAS